MNNRDRSGRAPGRGGRQGRAMSFRPRRTEFPVRTNHTKYDNNVEEERNSILRFKPLNLYEWQEYIVQYSIKTYGEVGQALRNLEYPYYINEDVFTLPDDEEAPADVNSIEYTIYKSSVDLRLKKWFKMKTTFGELSGKLFSDIILHMSEESRLITRQRTANFEELETNSDFVGLYQAIETAHINDGGPEATVVNQMEARKYLERLGQRTGQPLHLFEKEFTRRLQLCRGVGLEIPDKEVVLTYLSSLDQTVFLNKVQYFFEFESNEEIFPQNLQAAKEEIRKVLASHTAIKRRMKSLEYKRSGSRNNDYKSDDGERFANSANNNDNQYSGNFVKKDLKYAHIKCKCCEEMGHSAQVCPKLDKKPSANTANRSSENTEMKSEGNIKKSKTNTTNGSNQNSNKKKGQNTFFVETDSYCVVGITEANTGYHNEDQRQYIEILDSGCNTNIFSNSENISQVHIGDGININGVNGESPLILNNVGLHVDWGTTYINPTGRINIVSLIKQRDRYHVGYDSENDKFILTEKLEPSNVIEFQSNVNGLYERVYNNHISAITQHFTNDQKRRAEQARELHNKLSHPGDRALGTLLDNNGIINCPLTSADLRRATIIFGPCEACRIGKATLPKSFGLSRQGANYPGQILHLDIMFVPTAGRLLPFLVGVCDNTGFILSYLLRSKSKNNLLLTIQRFREFYDHHGWIVQRIITDPEGVFIGLHEEISTKLNIDMTATATGLHERVVERFIRTIRERIRINVHGQEYHVPSKLVTYSVNKPISDLNDTPNSKTGSVTPRQLVTGTKIDFKQDICPEWGTIVDVKIPTQKNASQERVEVGIVVGKSTNSRGGIKVIVLKDGELSQPKERHRYWIKYDIHDTILELNKIYKHEEKKLSKKKKTIVVNGNKYILTYDDYKNSGDVIDEDSEKDVVTLEDEDNTINSNIESDDDESLFVPSDDSIISDIVSLESEDESGNLPNEDIIMGNNDEISMDATFEDQDELLEEHQSISHNMSDNNEDGDNNPNYMRLRPTRSSWKNKVFDNYVAEQIETELSTQWQHYTFNITARKMVEQYGDVGKESIIKELLQLFEGKKVLIPIRNLPPNVKPITGRMFGKEKFTSTGVFDKLKSRYVGGGHLIDRRIYENKETSSPTASTESVLLTIALTANTKRKRGAVDFPSSYLNANLLKRHYMKIDKFLVDIIVEVLPEYAQFVQQDGTMFVEIVKALYGLPESSVRWYLHVTEFLKTLGYKASNYDKCLFYKIDKNVDIHKNNADIIVLYVDDILYSVNSSQEENFLLNKFKEEYGDIKIQQGNQLSYLGMNIVTDEYGRIHISMPHYIQELLKKHNVTKTVVSPSTKHLMTWDCNEANCNKHEYMSLLMSVYYLANKYRGDLLLTLSVLSSRARNSKISDMFKLTRVLLYLNYSKDYCLVFGIIDGEPNYDMKVDCDASHAIHIDCKGHTGLIILVGNMGVIVVKSWKQKSNATSTTHSELISLFDSTTAIMTSKSILNELNVPQQTIPVSQDNSSTIFIAENDFVKSTKMKYLKVRYHYVNELIKNKEISLVKVPTDKMKSDGLTKPLYGTKFKEFVNHIRLNRPFDKS